MIAKALTDEKEPVIHSSDPTGLALVAPRGTVKESDTSDTPSFTREASDTSEVRAFTEEEMLLYIEQKESKGNHLAQNPHSTAFGRFQFLNSTWGLVGCTKTSDPIEQERCAILYMNAVYGGIEGAYWFHLRNNYY